MYSDTRNDEKHPKKSVGDCFREHVNRDFKAYCQRHEMAQTDIGLITFLIDQDLIPSKELHRYTIMSEYEQLAVKEKFKKSGAALLLAQRFNISEQRVSQVLGLSAKPLQTNDKLRNEKPAHSRLIKRAKQT